MTKRIWTYAHGYLPRKERRQVQCKEQHGPGGRCVADSPDGLRSERSTGVHACARMYVAFVFCCISVCSQEQNSAMLKGEELCRVETPTGCSSLDVELGEIGSVVLVPRVVLRGRRFAEARACASWHVALLCSVACLSLCRRKARRLP